MDARTLYDIHRDSVLGFTGELPIAWSHLSWPERQIWEQRAYEQDERDRPDAYEEGYQDGVDEVTHAVENALRY